MMRNKLFTGFAALAVLCLLSGCASTDDGVKEVVFDQGDTNVVQYDAEEEQKATENNALLVTTDEKASAQIEGDGSVPASKEGKKNYTGWISTSVKPVSTVVGNIKLNAYPKKGTFAISVMNAAGKAIPVISSTNEYISTSFYLRAGKKIFKLNDDSSVATAAKKTANGITMRYTVERVGNVEINLECFATKEEGKEDTIKITSKVISASKKATDFSLKLVLDTVLGETDRHHFYLPDETPVKNEALYRSVKDEKYFISRNAKATMQIILDGADITPIDSVALANFTTLDSKKWEADMTSFRSFDTVLSYNNSAVAIYWPAVKLEPEQDSSNVFYISLACDEEIPGGYAFISGQEVPEKEEPAEPEKTVKVAEETPVQSIQAVKEEPKPEPKVAEQPKQEPVSIAPQNVSAVKEPATEDKSESPVDRLSYAYVQRLLDRIDQLEEGDPTVNKTEINALNAELDEILAIINGN